MHPDLQFMQDTAPGHSSRYTLEELKERGIIPVFWHAFSPDLNLIGTVWNWMKYYIENKYGDVQLSYDKLRVAVKETWDSITPDQLDRLIDTMQQRCEDVIKAKGRHIEW